MGFGFETGDGWFWLIDNLCKTIQEYIDNNTRVKQVEVAQVKEKFGGLRFYTNGNDELISGMIWLAESLSYHICEKCGSTEGKLINNKGWYRTLCNKCKK